jgi:LmbE family N-acetylglucosaminyl deacetylase/NOL1/NOP2/fmu family ribosome biogenesis protein
LREGRSSIRPLALLLTLAGLAMAVLLQAAPAQAAGLCLERTMFVVAHEDDDLLFQSPQLLEDIEDGDCVRTVFLTAGDAGMSESYWKGREAGSRAAYAEMAAVANTWTASKITANSRKIQLETLNGNSNVSQVNMRLPDGSNPGTGYTSTGNQSLAKLWRSQHSEPAGLTPISQINAIDGSASYDYEDLIETLSALIAEFEPDVISTQDYVGKFGEGDHSDHIATAYFTNLADASYRDEHVLVSYMDYQTRFQAQNVFPPLLETKSQVYLTYAAHDPQTCQTLEQCNQIPFQEYGEWFKRQVVKDESAVPHADAGPNQTVASKATVHLDGSGSSDPLGLHLEYEWTQTAGTAVTLADPEDEEPTFKAPTGPATLEFQLVVDNGEATSLPSTVKVTVSAPERHLLSVTKAGTGSGTVTSSPSGISCGSTCSAEFEHGTEVTLSPAAAAGSSFVKWTGSCTGSGSCKVTMSAAKSVGAEFALIPKFALKVTKSGNGSGTVTSSPSGISCGADCEEEYEQGKEVTLAPSPSAGSEFKGWSGACSGTGTCKVTMSAAKSVGAEFALEKHLLTVSKAGTGSGTVTSSPAGISCGSTCSASFDHGTEVTLTPAAGTGAEFVKWTGACTGSGSCKVTMSAAKSVGAEFALEKHQLSVTKSGAGGGTVTSSPAGIECGATCSAEYDHGTEVTVSQAASAGSSFVKWTGSCAGSGTCKVTMSAAKSVGAEFALIPKFALKVTKSGNGSGTVTSSPSGISCGADCEEEYEEGKEVTLSPSAASGSEFKGWSGACSGTGACKVTIGAAKSVGAEFVLEKHQLSVAKSGAGGGTVTSSPGGVECGATCSASFDHGIEVTLSQSPAAGSSFVKWTGSCAGSGSCKVTMSAAKSVGAEFALIPKFALKVTKSGNGGGTVTSSPTGINCGADCEEEYEQGKEVTLAPAATYGSEFVKWTGSCTGTGTCKVTVSAAKEVGAEFALERHLLSLTKSGAGSGTVTSSPAGISCGSTCSASFDHGTEVTLSPTPAGGSSFVKWTGACTGSGACKVAMTTARSVGAEFALIPKFTLEVTKGGNGAGTVTSSPAGINCGADCEGEYEEGKEVTLTPAASAGSEFTAWSGACTGTGTCKVTISAAKEVGAEFALEKHQLRVSKGGTGSGTITSSPSGIGCGATCSANFDHGTEVTLSAAAAGGSRFVQWTGSCTGTGSCSVTMSAAKSVGAEFALIPKFALEVTKSGNGSGTVTSSPAGIGCGSDCEEEYEEGQLVTLTPSASTGSEFKGWSGACSGTGACSVTMSAAKEVGAEFKLERHQLSVTTGGGGSGSVASSPAGIDCGPTCAASFDHGTEVTLSPSPAAGSSFANWTGACTGSGACKVTMTAAKTVGAEFSPVPKFALKITESGNGAGTVTSSPAGIECGLDCEEQFEQGSEVTLAASAEAGSEFKGWSGACNGTGACTVTMSALREVGAEFALERHELTVTPAGSGSGTITSSPAGIECGTTCAASFDQGTEVTLLATPGAGSEAVIWSGCDEVVAGDECRVSIDAARDVVATLDRTPPPETTPPPPETEPEPLLPPGTKLLRSTVKPQKRSATFAFAAKGSATAFQCALTKGDRKPKYRICTSPVTYKDLSPGRYTFKVRAVGASGSDATPVTKRFRIVDA